MRRLVPFIALALFLLPACRRAGPLAPEDVLRQTTQRSGQLQSVRYDATVTAAWPTGEASATIKGVLAGGGQQTSTDVVVNGELRRGPVAYAITIDASLISEFQHDLYVMLKSFSVDPRWEAFEPLQALAGQWWKVSRDGPAAANAVSPDPRFLRAQADVVRVVNDRGLQNIRGRDAYHYDVTLDPERFVEYMRASAEADGKPFDDAAARTDLERYDVRGELLIDAETFVLHRLRWEVTTRGDEDGMRVIIDADLFDHDAAPPIIPPSDAKPFDRDEFLKLLLPATPAL